MIVQDSDDDESSDEVDNIEDEQDDIQRRYEVGLSILKVRFYVF